MTSDVGGHSDGLATPLTGADSGDASGRGDGGGLGPLWVLNGPNLSRLGSREPDVYGVLTLADIATSCGQLGAQLGFEVDLRQTDSEAELVGWLHAAADDRIPVVLNPAAFTHYSYALRDACAQRTADLIEVHLSNPAAREEFRHTSVIAGVATGTIAGFGAESYLLAIRAIAERRAVPASGVATTVPGGAPASREGAATSGVAATDPGGPS